MSERDINSGVTSWRNNKPFPKDRYLCRCIEEKFAPSGSGNPMITRQWEIVSPETVTVGEGTMSVVGARVTQFLMTRVLDKGVEDKAKTDKAFGQLADDYKAMGYTKSTIDQDNPELIAKGKGADLIIYAKEDKQTKPLTNEDRLNGKKVGEPILDNSGQPIVKYQLQIEANIGLATLPAF